MILTRLLRRWRGPFLPVWHHAAYRLPLAASEMDAARADKALTWALDAGVTRPDDVRRPVELSWDDAALVHDDAYLAELDRPEVVAAILGADPARISVREMVETWRRASRGTLEAVRHVLDHGGRAANLLGGFHHADRRRGAGFCALNDLAVAVRAARRDGFHGRVIVVDLDAHPPDGTVDCLGDDPLVQVLSVSTESRWTVPPASAARVVDARVPAGSADAVYLEAVRALLRRADPADLALYLAGADPLVGDALGGLKVSEEGLRTRDREVLGALGRTPTVLLPAGGYHPRSWRVLAGSLSELADSDRAVAADYDPMQRRTRSIMATLDPADLGHPESDVLITEEDVMGALGMAPKSEPRFLGYYTRHGLEHALTAYGYLTTLRRLGFSDLQLAIESGQGPDRMLLTTDLRGERAALVDLAVSVRTIEGYRVLFVEWLELTDPRAPFTTGRPQLPGQRRPGLGIAEETLYLLIRAAERLDLAGIAFIPAHYHIAWMVRERFVVLDPAKRGRVRALARRVADLPLPEASRRLGGPGLPTEDGEVARWEPTEMVFPLDPGLAEVLARGEPRAAEAEEAWDLRLVDGSA